MQPSRYQIAVGMFQFGKPALLGSTIEHVDDILNPHHTQDGRELVMVRNERSTDPRLGSSYAASTSS
ncbi:hypothetical protein B5D80_04675 [Micromonospora wenchangensis]|uniref:Uncharacterized protein n=2 Tax=Micromonospora wenchangensis TaxID=1185415 RepID=A0A2D0AX90_9ACTN|nr:hypothetical protein B5D80_04675 [Micromonospora wenchangensis]